MKIFDVIETKDGEIGIIKEIKEGNIKIEIINNKEQIKERKIKDKEIKKFIYTK